MTVCPYTSYILSSIDNSYLKEKPNLSKSFSFSVYPYGKYSVSTINDLCHLSTSILNNLFSIIVRKGNLDKFDEKLVETNSLSKGKGLNILNIRPDYNKILNGKTTIDIIDHFFDKKLLLQAEVTNRYSEFYSNTIDYFHTISDSLNKSNNIDYENLFTVLWNIIVMLNSITQSDNTIVLNDNNINIVSIINRCYSTFLKIHPNRNPFFELQKTSPLYDIESFNKPYKSKDIDSARDNSVAKFNRLLESQYILYELYFECILLITHYRCEYEQLL